MITIEVNDGRQVTMVTPKAKRFGTGSRGFHASTKITINGRKYMCNFMLVEIGTKPK